MFKSLVKSLVLLSFVILFSGCLGDIMSTICDILPDSDHCYQASAEQESNPDRCEKIKGEKFKDIGSNPPRDKCYLEIAQNTGNYSVCNKIQGGMMSYSVEECILGTALKQNDAGGCKKLESYPSELASCKDALCSLSAVKSQDDEIDKIREELKNDPKNKDLSDKLAKLKDEKNERYEQMSEAGKGQYFKEKREAIMEDVEDADVQAAISKNYTVFRGNNKYLTVDQLLDKMKEIKAEQLTIKKADEDANTLMDTMKEQLQSFADDKKNEILDSAKEKGVEWIEKNGGENLKWTLKNLEWAKDKYEKGSEQYESLNKKYESIKKAYDEVKATIKKLMDLIKWWLMVKFPRGKQRC